MNNFKRLAKSAFKGKSGIKKIKTAFVAVALLTTVPVSVFAYSVQDVTKVANEIGSTDEKPTDCRVQLKVVDSTDSKIESTKPTKTTRTTDQTGTTNSINQANSDNSYNNITDDIGNSSNSTETSEIAVTQTENQSKNFENTDSTDSTDSTAVDNTTDITEDITTDITTDDTNGVLSQLDYYTPSTGDVYDGSGLAVASIEYEYEGAASSVGITDYDILLLRRIVSSEYGSYWVPVEEKAKIVASVMNMMKHPSYPATIEEILAVSCEPWGFDRYNDYYLDDSIIMAVDYYFSHQSEFGTYKSWYGDGTWNYFHNYD